MKREPSCTSVQSVAVSSSPPLLLAACAGAPAPPSPVADAAVAEGDETVASPAAPSAAQVLLDKALAGFGGVQRVDRLRTLVVESTMTRNLAEGQQTEIRQRSYVEFPDRFRSEAILEDMTVASVVAPGGSFLLSPFGTLPIPEEERVEIERGLARSPLSLLKGRRHETFFVQAEGDGEIDGRAVDYLRVLFIGDSNRLAIDRETGQVLELQLIDRPLSGAEEDAREVVIRYSDHREADGLIYPFRSLTTRDGETPVRRTVHTFEADVELDPALFQPPAQ